MRRSYPGILNAVKFLILFGSVEAHVLKCHVLKSGGAYEMRIFLLVGLQIDA